jgi:hypothetical protein
VANNKDPDQKRPGEKEPGKFHYNPGNMSGKTKGSKKGEADKAGADGKHGAEEQQNKEEVTSSMTDEYGS